MTVGSMLREQREKLGLDLPAMATYLRIRLPFLQSIENDAFNELPPGNAYRIGFIKSYASALNLDVEEAVALFRKEQVASTQKTPLRVRVPISDSRTPTISVIGIVLVLIAACWVSWAFLHRSDRTMADEVPPVPERLQEKPVQAEAAAPVPPAVPSATPAPATPAPVTAADSTESDEARDETYNHEAGAQIPNRAATQAAAVPAGHELSGDTGPYHVQIVSLAESWVQIRDSGKVVYTGVMHPGDTYRVPDRPGWTMTAGNSGGIILALDGKNGAPLGAAGEVARNVPLDTASVATQHP